VSRVPVLVFGLLLGAAQALASPSVEYRLSRIHGLVNFAETAIGEPHRSRALREYFEKSSLNNSEVREILARFKDAYSQLGDGYQYDGYPKSRPQGSSGQSVLLIQSVFAMDVKDLGERTLGMMPLSAHGKLMAALRDLLPHYTQEIWSPSLSKLEAQGRAIHSLAAKMRMDELFMRAAKFYDASWPEDRSFVVSLYPIPGKSGHTSAQSLENVESVGVLTESPDLSGELGVVFHELCHSLYDAQTPEVQESQEKWFLGSANVFGPLAYEFINEAMATALGNGLAYELVTGKPDEGSWYGDAYIEGLARGIYDKVKEHIQMGVPIDKAFVSHAIATFAERFPHALHEYDNLMSGIVVLADWENLDRTRVREAMLREFRIKSRSIYGTVDDTAGLEVAKSSSQTVVVIASLGSVTKLSALEIALPQAAEAVRAASSVSTPSVIWGKLSASRSLLILLASDTVQAEALFGRMRRAGRVDPATLVQKLPD